MGIYSKYKDKLPRVIGSAPEDGGESNDWNDEVTAREKHYARELVSKEKVAELYSKLRGQKDAAEAEKKRLSVDVEALNRLLVKLLERDGATGIALASGEKFDIDDKPHSSYEDKAAFLKWIDDNDMREMLTMQWQVMNSTVKQRLEAGLEPPPGVKVFLRSAITRRKAKK